MTLQTIEMPRDVARMWIVNGLLRGEACAWYELDRLSWKYDFEFIRELAKAPNDLESSVIRKNKGRIDFWENEPNTAGRGHSYSRVVLNGLDIDLWERIIQPTLIELNGEAVLVMQDAESHIDLFNLARDGHTECPHCGFFHRAVCPRIQSIETIVGDGSSTNRVTYHREPMFTTRVSQTKYEHPDARR